MRELYLSLIFVMCGLFMSGLHAQTDSTKVTPYWLGAENAAEEVRRCTPNATNEMIERWRRASGSASVFLDQTTNRFATASGDMWACLQLSPSGYTVFPLSALQSAVIVQGIAHEKLLGFFTGIQKELAQSGYAKALIALKDGKRQITYFTADQRPSATFSVRSTTLEAGKVNDGDFPLAILDVTSGASIRTSGTENQASIFSNLLAPRPLRGQYLRLQGNAETDNLDVAGSTWRSVRTPSETITFEHGGILLQKTKTSNTLGTWAKDGNVIYFDNKFLYQSGVLTAWENIKILDAQTRRAAYTQPGIQAVFGVTSAAAAAMSQAREIPEFRGRNAYLRVGDAAAEASVIGTWNVRVKTFKEGVERNRQSRLTEMENADWLTKTSWWSLCTVNIFNDADLAADLEGGKAPEYCRAFSGTRKVWQTILQDGCNNRCAPVNFPMF